jgi:UDPglucose 6-dehydrogenase
MLGHAGGALQICDDAYDAAAGASTLVVLTEWPEFTELELSRVAALLGDSATLVDARNLLDPELVRAAGLHYDGVGRR